jgi:twitching motility two-component system response regulator PilH
MSPPAHASNKRTVIVADPDAEERQRIVTVLSKLAADLGLSIAVHEFERGDEVDAKFRELRPELVVAEILLEGTSGMTLLRRYGDAVPKPAWIFVTHMTTETDRYWALRNGAHAYVMKPFDAAVLENRLAKLLGEGGESAPEKLV